MENAVNVKNNIRNMCAVGLMSAVMCVIAPLSVPIGPVPISLTNLAVFFALYALGTRLGVLSYFVYLLLGMVGLPVFSGFTGGLGKLAGPTGGYIIGFLPMALISGTVMDRFSNRAAHFVGMVLGTAACYTLGTAWFCTVMHTGVMAALGQAVFPFIPVDLVKIAFAALAGPTIRARLQQYR